MARIDPLPLDALPDELRNRLGEAEERMGFASNDIITMARWPELLGPLEGLIGTIYGSREVSLGLKRMMAMVASNAAGCRYCEAHTAHGAAQMSGVDAQKVAAVWEYQTSDLFTDAERTALDLAFAAGQVPNATTEAHFEALRAHWTERQIVEMVALISLFGFLNRWNDTLATPLEDAPLSFALESFGGDWKPGKHA
ncbi:carboxymuconolactone decarboxylase [Parasphingopyxis sp. CP4]|uniref:carboxymuconolactone decarboxylase family protein n=1 Tax=Parasphingopyxis sp. CP4 TaxID=2724527 RepID=UPI0015A4EA82|nr:carboxymuconolactone decarboxylase family protein [Parasphingopyxis sp. CP4]QLC23098.1 carboxymuconolactone decarboxylase [Parasphingopyxis sp. CP4]